MGVSFVNTSNQPKLEIKARGYKVIKDFVEIKVDKTILYGPNGAGKSSVMELIYAVLNGKMLKPDTDLFHQDFEIFVVFNKDVGRIVRKGKEYEVVVVGEEGEKKYRRESVENPNDAFRMLNMWLGIKNEFKVVAWIDSCHISIANEHGLLSADICEKSEEEFHQLFRSLTPDDLHSVIRTFSYLFEVSRFAYASDKRYGTEPTWWIYSVSDGSWIRISNLAYGYRRTLSTILTLHLADAILIEGFEAGLHVDLAIDLVRIMNLDSFKDKIIVIETHNGNVMSRAISELKWMVYYM